MVVIAHHTPSHVGSELRQIALNPGGLVLRGEGGAGVRMVAHAPQSVSVRVVNSGQQRITRLAVIVLVAGHALPRTIANLPVASQRVLRFALPKHLPPSFTISVRTLPVAGERNLSNNRATWRIRVRG
ncbi:MAG TPA: hypothetical protein VGF46_01985 [Gaiellales bacterium]